MKEMIELVKTDRDMGFKSDASKIPDFNSPANKDTGSEIKNNIQLEGKLFSTTDSAKIPDFNHAFPHKKTFDNESPNIDTSDNSAVTDGFIRIETKNQDLEGKEHPVTKVPFVRIQITLPSGEVIEGVFPVFDSKYDVQLPEELFDASDKEQVAESNKQLKDWVKNNPEKAKEKFTKEQLEDIDNGRTPEGYTWHHNEEPGKMQLIDSETHAKTGHTGGKSIWGGGSNNR